MIFTLKVALADVTPVIWRRVRVPGGLTLRELHDVLQVAMGWENAHLHSFTIGDEKYGQPDPMFGGVKNETRVALEAVAGKGSRFIYTYDFGDALEHEVLVEDVSEHESGALLSCTDGKRACPPEDCGGVWGYGDVLAALEAPTNPAHADRLEWLGDAFDPEAFDIEQVNRRLTPLGDGLRDKLRLRALKESARKRSGPGRSRSIRRRGA